MPYSYKPLWALLAEKEIGKTEFRKAVGLSTTTLAKLSANKPVSPDVLARICNFFGCHLENVATFVSDVELFMISIERDILEWDYTVYIDKWPECRFKLTPQQAEFLDQLNQAKLKQIISNYENVANLEYQPNGGILDTTKVKFDPLTSKLIINGSFGVVEKFMQYLINASK